LNFEKLYHFNLLILEQLDYPVQFGATLFDTKEFRDIIDLKITDTLYEKICACILEIYACETMFYEIPNGETLIRSKAPIYIFGHFITVLHDTNAKYWFIHSWGKIEIISYLSDQLLSNI